VAPWRLWSLLKQASAAWWADRAMSMGAALAFYTAFSLAPMLLLVIAVAGLVFGTEAAQDAIVRELGTLFGDDGASALDTMLRGARDQDAGIVGTIVGTTTLLLLATGALVELQDALNRIWRAEPPQLSGLLEFLRTRLLSLALILVIGFLLLVALVVDAGLAALGDYVGALFPGSATLIVIIDVVLSIAVISGLFAMIYKILPDVSIAWSDVVLGAVCAAALFSVGKIVIGIYIGQTDLVSTFGAAKAIIVILLWVYYSSMIVLFGAEIAKAHSTMRRGHADSTSRLRKKWQVTVL
jgi:membrane protein